MANLVNHPTGTYGIQKAFGRAIRRTFRESLLEIYYLFKENKETLSESLILKSALDKNTISRIHKILEQLKIKLSPIVRAFIQASWHKANNTVAKQMKVGEYVPFDKRVVKLLEDSTYLYLIKYIDGRHDELKSLLQQGISQGDTIPTIAKQVKDTFKTTAWKSELIARSETIRTYGESTLYAIKQSGVTDKYQWKTSLKENVCHICKPLHNKVFSINDQNAPKPVTNTHPQCNCSIAGYIDPSEYGIEEDED
jgi:SPP1 gp7 family putative phage head morphogenesis protein